MENKHEFTMNIGLPSIMLIFVVLCLVSLGVLSLVSAATDNKFSRKVLERAATYYGACNRAEEMLCEVDKKLHDAYINSQNSDEYFSLISGIPKSYAYEISGTQRLEVTLSFSYSDPLYQIMAWNVVTKDEADYDTGMRLMDFGEIE